MKNLFDRFIEVASDAIVLSNNTTRIEEISTHVEELGDAITPENKAGSSELLAKLEQDKERILRKYNK